MPSISHIRREIAALPYAYVFFTGKEIRALPKILAEDESVLALTSGMMEGCTWLAVCTPQRLIFLHRGMVFGMRQVQLPLERVESVDSEFSLLFGAIRVWDGASAFSLRWVLKRSVEPFVNTVQEAMRACRQRTPGPAPAAPDVATQLEKLAGLHERGLLTREEFEREKKRILE